MSDWQVITGDCLEVMRGMDTGSVDAVITDPPYGMGNLNKFGSRSRLTKAQPYTPIIGDDKPFNPSHLIDFPIVVLFGANWYADKLPPSGGWVIWDKKDGLPPNNFSDGEMAWIKNSNTVRIFRHRWSGMLKASEQNERRVHPMQKPIALMAWILEKYTMPGDTVLDPYCGSGPVGVACIQTGRRFIGIEIDPTYADIARARCEKAAAQAKQLELL